MYKGILDLHITVVVIFLLIYLIKTTLLLLNKQDSLQKFSKKIKVPEMIVSSLFLLTGIYLWINSGDIGTWFYIKVAAVLISIPLAVIGFKRNNKVLAVFSVILLMYAYGVAETKSPHLRKAKIVKEDSGLPQAEMGKAIYESYCANCHGMDGRAGLSGSTDLSASKLDYNAKLTIISEGKGIMNPFKDILSDAEIASVANYIEIFKH